MNSICDLAYLSHSPGPNTPQKYIIYPNIWG